MLQFDIQDGIRLQFPRGRGGETYPLSPNPNRIDGWPSSSLHTCLFCGQYVDWNLDDLTKVENGLKPVTYTPKYFDCPRCGRVALICQVSEDEKEVSLRFILGGSALEEMRNFLDSLSGGSIDASEKIAYGVLGGLTKDGIEKLYHEARRKDGTTNFEQDLGQILERYKMRLCSFCNRPVKKTDSFCIHCGRALI